MGKKNSNFLKVSKQIVPNLRMEFMVPKEYTGQHMKRKESNHRYKGIKSRVNYKKNQTISIRTHRNTDPSSVSGPYDPISKS